MSIIHEVPCGSGCNSMDSSTPELFSELLQKEKTRLQSELRGRLEILHGDRVAPDDEGPLLHEQFVSMRQNDLAYEKLKAIEAALDRMQSGEYAICQRCGDYISEKRLRAVPWAAYCLDCQDMVLAGRNPPFRRRIAA